MEETTTSKKSRVDSLSSNAVGPDPNIFGQIPDSASGKNIAEIIGIFADEPLWDEVMAEIMAFREKQNAADALGQATK